MRHIYLKKSKEMTNAAGDNVRYPAGFINAPDEAAEIWVELGDALYVEGDNVLPVDMLEPEPPKDPINPSPKVPPPIPVEDMPEPDPINPTPIPGEEE